MGKKKFSRSLFPSEFYFLQNSYSELARELYKIGC